MKKNGDEKKFISIANEIGELVQEKNKAYGDSFARSQEIVKILYPDGVRSAQYTDMLAITRVIDKLFRIATKKDAFGESPWRDICGYAILGIANDEVQKVQQSKEQPKESTIRASIIQGVRRKREEGHANPYANIDDDDKRNVQFSYDNTKVIKVEPGALMEIFPNLNEILDNLEQAEAEGNKEKKDNAPINFDEWNKIVSESGKQKDK